MMPVSWRIRLALALATAVAVLLAAWVFVARGAPPRTVTMVTGPPGGTAAALGERYRALLAQAGVELRLVPTAGDAENLERLRDPASGASAGVVIAGLSGASETTGIVSLGTIGYQPIWVFERAEVGGRTLTGLAHSRVSLDLPGSGTRAMAGGILALNGIDPRGYQAVALPPEEAADRLLRGDLDVAVLVAEWDAPAVRRLIGAPQVALRGFPRADALVALNPNLSRLVLPAGVGDLAANRPPSDVVLVAPKASLLVRGELHEAVQFLLLDAAAKLHARPGLFHPAGAFPAPEAIDFPLSEEATRYYRAGRPFLQRYLPFWAAVLLERLLLVTVPVVGLLLPLGRGLAGGYRALVEQRVAALYAELRAVEAGVEADQSQGDRAALVERLDALEQRASRLRIPARFSRLAYTLRQHLHLVRERLED
jgi:TRAP-type uncharacterized transport system substrate-binding protein